MKLVSKYLWVEEQYLQVVDLFYSARSSPSVAALICTGGDWY